ncbi:MULTISPECIES: MarR family transcriptional regulator [Halorussus]|uniref:MarR family transcriptional regulator n=1 Tax=Halorussus TaxID=1070314 RepID=UPI000E219876|nr:MULTISPECIES: MarR family transcriptional regulator [Halorussus]NHN60449.1 MarR family transcriptional regulator [Halorussus sp. JP-T4]
MQLDDVDSPRAKLVLLYLQTNSPCPPRHLAEDLDASLLTILGVLDMMRRNWHVERRNGNVTLPPD